VLQEDPDNARKHSHANLAAIRKSLENFGQVQTLCVRAGTGIVIGGNGREVKKRCAVLLAALCNDALGFVQ